MHSSACVANDSAPSRASPLLSDRERMYLAFVSSFPRRIHSVLYRDNIMCRMRKIISVRAVFFASKLWQNFSVYRYVTPDYMDEFDDDFDDDLDEDLDFDASEETDTEAETEDKTED